MAEIIRRNPHLAGSLNPIKYNTPPPVFLDDPRIKAKEYQTDNDLYRGIIHLGQRKLLLTEVKFLTHVAQQTGGDIFRHWRAVYAGSAPAYHNILLQELFPQVHWILWDPAPFGIKEQSGVVEIHNDYFTDPVAATYGGAKDILFISDIRRMGHKSAATDTQESQYLIEKGIVEDNEMQQRWVELIRPRFTMLKLHFPFQLDERLPSQVSYFDGKIMMQPWVTSRSTETRLIFEDVPEKIIYNVKKYENEMYGFNVGARQSAYPYPFANLREILPKGFDNCWDCAAEMWIWHEYLETYHGKSSPKKIADLVVKTNKLMGYDLFRKCLKHTDDAAKNKKIRVPPGFRNFRDICNGFS